MRKQRKKLKQPKEFCPSVSPSTENGSVVIENNHGLLFSLYSQTDSNLHMFLNTFASSVLLTESAFAFAGVSIGNMTIFSSLMSYYALSIISYIFSIYFLIESKRKVLEYLMLESI